MCWLSLSSLRLRLLLVVLLALGPALALIVANGLETRRAAIAETQETALRLAELASRSLEDRIAEARQLLLTLAQLREVRDRDPGACRQLFGELLARHPIYANLGAADAAGDVYCSALPVPGPVTIADRLYFRQALATLDFAVGEYQTGRITGRASVNVGSPVLDRQGTVRGVVFAAIDLAGLNRLVTDTRLPAGSSLTVVDRNGTILVRHPEPGRWVGQALPAAPAIRVVRTGTRGVGEALELDGAPSLLGFAPLPGAHGDLLVSIGIPREAALAAANHRLLRNLAALGIVGALALAAAWYGSEALVVRRVRNLIAATRRLAAGDLRARAGGPYHGELGELARAFDDMARALEGNRTELAWRAEALRERTETLRALVDASPLAIVALDREGMITLWNRAAERMFGWRTEEVLGRPLPLVPPDLEAEFRDLFARAWRGEVLANIETRRRRQDGTTVAVSIASAPVYDVNAAVSAVLAIYADITEKLTAAAELERQRRALFEQEKLAELGRLAAGVAHELKNPLTVLEGRVHLIRGVLTPGTGAPTDPAARHLAGIAGALERMKRILQGLSNYARPSKAEPVAVDVGELLASIRELVAFPARQCGATVRVEVAAEALQVLGDRSELTQILLNLATNAIEAMGETGGAVTLAASIEPAPDGTDRVAIEVRDTGPGISPEALEKIWEPFYTTKADGTGLGLSIVRGLVEKQPGAEIAVTSQVGAGTTFRLTLPRHGAAHSTRQAAEKSAP